MSGTRSPFPKAPATEPRTGPRTTLIVAHGSPSQPRGPEAAIRALAARVAGLLPRWTLQGATLAAPGAVEAALDRADDDVPLIYPFFMADGWFVRKTLPERVRRIRGERFEIARPFGLDPALRRLCLDCLRRAATREGVAPNKTAVLLAAHGSPSDPRPRRAAEGIAQAIASAGLFREIRLGFIDQAPLVAEAAGIDAPALCLPLFAGRSGHVERDLPDALADAGFPGVMLDPIGVQPEVSDIVAAGLVRHLQESWMPRPAAVSQPPASHPKPFTL